MTAQISGVPPGERDQSFGSSPGIHLEQSAKARVFHKEIAGAVANVFASPWRWLLWTLMRAFR